MIHRLILFTGCLKDHAANTMNLIDYDKIS